ncbi:MAG TPA: hypothetical protein VJB14_05890 [Planctomycetota bacterium]|nr:hypothetical protein [Planctomycetota bacterium]
MTRFLILAAAGLMGGAAVSGGRAIDFLWTAPVIIGAAFLIAWGAEAAQFMMSQGLALAILALLQTLPEFAVEATLAWDAARDPSGEKNQFVTANFTGSIRLLMGFGMPIVFFIHFFTHKGPARRVIELDTFHSVEVVSLFPATVYFFFIVYRGKLDLLDAVVLLAFYVMYMGLLLKMPAEEEGESIEELPFVARQVLKRGRVGRIAGVTLIFILGGLLLYVCVHPFVESMKAVALKMGISSFIVMQWIAPFLSEFPEKLSAFNWARQPGKAKLGLMNFVSSNINQMTMLVAMIPIVYAISGGQVRPVVFDAHQREEVLLTACQAALCMVLLFNMKFEWWDAVGMFVLWGAQAVLPSLRGPMIWAYVGWIVLEVFLAMVGYRKWNFPLRLGKDSRRFLKAR